MWKCMYSYRKIPCLKKKNHGQTMNTEVWMLTFPPPHFLVLVPYTLNLTPFAPQISGDDSESDKGEQRVHQEGWWTSEAFQKWKSLSLQSGWLCGLWGKVTGLMWSRHGKDCVAWRQTDKRMVTGISWRTVTRISGRHKTQKNALTVEGTAGEKAIGIYSGLSGKIKISTGISVCE